VGVVGGVAGDDALDVTEFVEDGGEEIVVSVGGGAGSGLEGGGGEGGGVFDVVFGGGVEVPA
jgi:hypothetical protein